MTDTRELKNHKVNGLNERLVIEVLDPPGPGGANHNYAIRRDDTDLAHIQFQIGPILEHGVNGISNEALLAIVEDRLIGFQAGKFATGENALALTKVQEAMMWLHRRTIDRVDRGVEGKNES